MAVRSHSLEKYRAVMEYSSSCVAMPKTFGDKCRRTTWLEANVRSRDTSWIKIRNVVPWEATWVCDVIAMEDGGPAKQPCPLCPVNGNSFAVHDVPS